MIDGVSSLAGSRLDKKELVVVLVVEHLVDDDAGAQDGYHVFAFDDVHAVGMRE